MELYDFIIDYGYDSREEKIEEYSNFKRSSLEELIEKTYVIRSNGKQIKEFPKDIDKLYNLKLIIWGFNMIEYIPKLPESLEILSMPNNVIDEIYMEDYSIEYLKNLKKLILSNNNIKMIPRLNEDSVIGLIIDNNPINYIFNDNKFISNLKYFSYDKADYIPEIDKLYFNGIKYLIKNHEKFSDKNRYEALKLLKQFKEDR